MALRNSAKVNHLSSLKNYLILALINLQEMVFLWLSGRALR